MLPWFSCKVNKINKRQLCISGNHSIEGFWEYYNHKCEAGVTRSPQWSYSSINQNLLLLIFTVYLCILCVACTLQHSYCYLFNYHETSCFLFQQVGIFLGVGRLWLCAWFKWISNLLGLWTLVW